MKKYILILSFLVFATIGNSQGENLAVTAPNITNPLPSVEDGGSGVLSFTVFNINGGYTASCGATIAVHLSQISVNSIASSSLWVWDQPTDTVLIGTLVGDIGTFYFEEVTIDFNVTEDSAFPGTNGFEVITDTGSCADGNTIDNRASTYTYTYEPEPIADLNLISLTAKKVRDDIVIRWKIESGTNPDYFEVQRSTDMVEFSPIGQVEASDARNYKFTDIDAALIGDVIHYRIKQRDLDGVFSISSIVSVSLSVNQNSLMMVDVGVYPNPTNGAINIEMPFYSNFKLNIYDNYGRLIKAINSEGQKSFDLHYLNAGIYHIEIFSDQKGTSTFYGRSLFVKK